MKVNFTHACTLWYVQPKAEVKAEPAAADKTEEGEKQKEPEAAAEQPKEEDKPKEDDQPKPEEGEKPKEGEQPQEGGEQTKKEDEQPKEGEQAAASAEAGAAEGAKKEEGEKKEGAEGSTLAAPGSPSKADRVKRVLSFRSRQKKTPTASNGARPAKKIKLSSKLSALVNYIQSIHVKGFDGLDEGNALMN